MISDFCGGTTKKKTLVHQRKLIKKNITTIGWYPNLSGLATQKNIFSVCLPLILFLRLHSISKERKINI